MPWTRSEPFPRGRIRTTSGDVVVLALADGLVDGGTAVVADGCWDGVAAVVTVDVQAAAANSNAAMPRELGREPTARR